MNYKIVVLSLLSIFLLSCIHDDDLIYRIISEPDYIDTIFSDSSNFHPLFIGRHEDLNEIKENLKKYIVDYFTDGYFLKRKTKKTINPFVTEYDDFVAFCIGSKSDESKEFSIDLYKISEKWVIYQIDIGTHEWGW